MSSSGNELIHVGHTGKGAMTSKSRFHFSHILLRLLLSLDYKIHRESSSDFNFTIPVLELQFKEDFDILLCTKDVKAFADILIADFGGGFRQRAVKVLAIYSAQPVSAGNP